MLGLFEELWQGFEMPPAAALVHRPRRRLDHAEKGAEKQSTGVTSHLLRDHRRSMIVKPALRQNIGPGGLRFPRIERSQWDRACLIG